MVTQFYSHYHIFPTWCWIVFNIIVILRCRLYAATQNCLLHTTTAHLPTILPPAYYLQYVPYVLRFLATLPYRFVCRVCYPVLCVDSLLHYAPLLLYLCDSFCYATTLYYYCAAHTFLRRRATCHHAHYRARHCGGTLLCILALHALYAVALSYALARSPAVACTPCLPFVSVVSPLFPAPHLLSFLPATLLPFAHDLTCSPLPRALHYLLPHLRYTCNPLHPFNCTVALYSATALHLGWIWILQCLTTTTFCLFLSPLPSLGCMDYLCYSHCCYFLQVVPLPLLPVPSHHTPLCLLNSTSLLYYLSSLYTMYLLTPVPT